MDLVEIYVLCKGRSQVLVLTFLEHFLPNREEVAEDYPYPEYADIPKHVYDDHKEIIGALEKDINKSYSLYWNDTSDGDIRSAMIFFTEDAGMIAGITVAAGEEGAWLKKLSDCLGGRYGYVGFDAPPPETKAEFIDFCKSTDQTRLIDGKLLSG